VDDEVIHVLTIWPQIDSWLDMRRKPRNDA
jgi:hypothetical protein